MSTIDSVRPLRLWWVGMREREPLESDVKDAIRLAVGGLPYVRLFNNPVGEAVFYDPKQKRERRIVYGLAPGSADLIGIIEGGRFLSIEVKRPGGRTDPKRAAKQKAWREMINAFGGLAIQVESAEEAVEAVERARKGESC